MKNYCKKCELSINSNDIMKEQAKRIVELKKEVNDLSIALEVYRSKEAEITETIVFAKNKAKEMLKEAKIRNALECERLKLYRNKWLRYIKDKNKTGKLAEDINRTNEVLKECQIQLEDMLYNDLDIDANVTESYIDERERLDDEPSLDYEEIINETKKEPLGRESLTNSELEDMLAKLKI